MRHSEIVFENRVFKKRKESGPKAPITGQQLDMAGSWKSCSVAKRVQDYAGYS